MTGPTDGSHATYNRGQNLTASVNDSQTHHAIMRPFPLTLPQHELILQRHRKNSSTDFCYVLKNEGWLARLAAPYPTSDWTAGCLCSKADACGPIPNEILLNTQQSGTAQRAQGRALAQPTPEGGRRSRGRCWGLVTAPPLSGRRPGEVPIGRVELQCHPHVAKTVWDKGCWGCCPGSIL